MIFRFILCAAVVAAPASARMMRPTTDPAMRAAFPGYNPLNSGVDWHREKGQGPKGVFEKDWAKEQVRVSPRALVPLGGGLTGLIVGGMRYSAGMPSDCHACSGMLTLIPMRQQNGRWQVAGLARDLGENGDWGQAGEVTPVTIAGAPGFGAVASGGGQGYSVTVLHVWKLAANGSGKRLTKDMIQIAGDTSGVVDGCDGKRKLAGRECYNIDGGWRIDPGTGALTISYTGMRDGRKLAATNVWRLTPTGYAKASGTNPLPEY